MKRRHRKQGSCVAVGLGLMLLSCGGEGEGRSAESSDIGFTMDSEVAIGALAFTVDYDADVGEFEGAADRVTCAAPVGDLVAFNHKREQQSLLVGMTSINGFLQPSTIVSCTFERAGAEAPSSGDFSVTVTFAESPAGVQIDPLPSVNISVDASS